MNQIDTTVQFDDQVDTISTSLFLESSIKLWTDAFQQPKIDALCIKENIAYQNIFPYFFLEVITNDT